MFLVTCSASLGTFRHVPHSSNVRYSIHYRTRSASLVPQLAERSTRFRILVTPVVCLSLPETTRRRKARVQRSSCLCVRLNSVFELTLLSYRVLESLIINTVSRKKLFSVSEVLDLFFPRQEKLTMSPNVVEKTIALSWLEVKGNRTSEAIENNFFFH